MRYELTTSRRTGEKYAPFLTQRNNNTYRAFAQSGPSTGKTVIAQSKANGRLIIISQPHGATGESLDTIRDGLLSQGVENAVFLDGSDSAILHADGTDLVTAGPNKDTTNTVGIGF